MRKGRMALLVFVALMLCVPSALSAWKTNKVINETEENVYVIYSTWRGAKDGIPRGFRTRGYYRVAPGQERSFYAWNKNRIYFRILQSGEAIKPEASSETFGFYLHPSRAFTVVSGKIVGSVGREGLTYSSVSRGDLSQEDGFMVYSNGSRVQVTSEWVLVNTPPDPPPGADEEGEDLGSVGPSSGGVTPPPVGSVPVGMVLIPAGEFQMGSNNGRNNEKPVHSVYVDAFHIDKYEVTNAQYAEFLTAKGTHVKGDQIWLDIAGDGDEKIEFVIEFAAGGYRAKAGYANHPVVGVSWYGAMAYAKWAGKRLPTEAEWEKAARGGLSGLRYPWGNTIDSSKANYTLHIGDTTAVGKYPASGYGLYDMSGNVLEWCLDEYNSGFYAVSPARNPVSGADSIMWIVDNYTKIRSSRVLRGGAWNSGAQGVRCAYRDNNAPSYAYGNYGFRCVRSVTPANQ